MQAPRRWSTFDLAVGLVWSNDPESYADSSVATVRASDARGVKGDDPGKKGCPGLPGWVLGVRLSTPLREKYVMVRSF